MTGTKTLQFKASNIRFLIKNNFDFNKLFTLGVNYQRLSDKETILKKSGDAQQFTSRQYTKLGSTSQALLDSYIRKVHNFFSLQKKTTDLLVLELDIESYALRRRLQQVLQGIYRNKGGIYTNFQRTAPKFVVKLLQPKEQEESKIQAKVVKVTEEQCCVSEYDRVIKGDHNNEVYFEDDVCIAFQNEDKAAKQHFTVLAKKNTIQSAGRLLLVAKEVALQLGMTEGYRIVMD
jgi:diadenosine tetraphosphate (Ap4A) HIT family hydrolase